MISHQKKFIFIHVGKTGGNSCNLLLQKYSDQQVVITKKEKKGRNAVMILDENGKNIKHLTALEYREKLGQEKFNSFYKFAFVRNPWDRMVSYFSFFYEHEFWYHLILPQENRRSTPNHYILRRFNKMLLNLRYRKKFKMLPFLTDESGKIIVDYIGKFEEYKKCLKEVFDKLEIPFAETFHENKTQHSHYSFYYDETTKQFVADWFKDEISLFGYKFERKNSE